MYLTLTHKSDLDGTNSDPQPVPWNRMEGKHMERPMVEDKWSRKIAKENKRRADRAKKLEGLGYEYNAPDLTDAAEAIAAAATAAEVEAHVVEASEVAVIKAIEAAPVAEEAQNGEVEEQAVEDTPRPAKRGRGRPPKTGAAEATPNKRVKRTKA